MHTHTHARTCTHPRTYIYKICLRIAPVNLSLLHRTFVLLQPPDFNPAQHNHVLDERFCSGEIDAAGLEVTFSQDDTAARGGGNGGDMGQVSGGVGGASEANDRNDDAADDSIATNGGGVGGEGGRG